MNVKKMREEVQSIVDDSAFDSKTIIGFISESFVAGVLEADLPEFKKAGSILTSGTENFVSMLDDVPDYGKMVQVLPSGGQRITVFDSLEEMLIEDGAVLGTVGTNVQAVAVEGSNLWYHPLVVGGQTIQFIYKATPDALTSDGDEVTLFPDLIQRKICVHGAAALCFEKIEDALEAPDKLNTNYHRKMYYEGVQNLKEWNGRRRKHKSSSIWGV